MELHNLKPAKGAVKNAKRIGRGEGSKRGGTSTRGHKGAKSRSGYSKKIGFEGGQMPLQKRLPKFGFSSRIGRLTAQIRLGELNRIQGDVIDLEALRSAGIVSKNTERVRVFLSGEILKSITTKGLVLTAGARRAVEEAGGKVQD